MMKNNKIDRKLYIRLIASSFIFYLMSISIKMVYSAELVSIISHFNTSKSIASLGLTIYYLIYALTQLIISSSKIKFDMYKFLVYTTIPSALSFGAIIFANDIWQVWGVLALNGILQSSIYGGIMHLLTKYLPEAWFNRTSIILSFAFALGTAIAYGISALGVAFLNWKYAFVIFAVLLLLSLIVFCAVLNACKRHFGDGSTVEKATDIDTPALQQNVGKRKMFAIMSFILVTNFLVCCLYYGATNWVPSLLKEIHDVPESYSLLITISVPLTMLPGPILGNHYADKTGKVYTICAAFFAICAVCMMAMIFVYDLNIVLAILLSLIMLFFNRAIVNLLTSYLPFKLNKVIDASKSSMMINAIACIGAAVMPFITGVIMDNFGWTAYYISMFSIAAPTTVIFIFGMKYSKKLLS